MPTRYLLILCLLTWPAAATFAQPGDDTTETEEVVEADETKEVGVDAVAEDNEISARLERIMEATEWFSGVDARVEEGVVFLRGVADSESHREWAVNLARRTQDVVAVVNKLTVKQKSIFDFSPATSEIESMLRTAVQSLPITIMVVVLLLLTWFATKIAASAFRYVAERRVSSRLLSGVLSRAAAVPIALLGIYLALKVAGLTRLAATVLGGTGLLGIVIGIAFRDIAENFLASILISIQRPFRAGDMVQIDEHEGYVQGVTTRGTSLMTLDGNHIQVPNATIYKSIIINKSSNPNMRHNFVIGIDYEDSASEAQEVILNVLRQHPTVLEDPEPMILVDALAASTVNLIVHFWVNEEKHNGLKVRSAIMRLAKQSLIKSGITMPDESREVIFPRGIPVRMLDDKEKSGSSIDVSDSAKKVVCREEQAISAAEGDMESDKQDIQEQAKRARPLEGDAQNLLADEEGQSDQIREDQS